MRSSYCSARWPTGEVAVSVAGSAAQPEGGLDSRRSRSAACGRALWPSWWSRAATCVRCRNGRDNNVAFTLTRYGSLLEDGSDGVYLPAARVERG
jgi:hypothetical protein